MKPETVLVLRKLAREATIFALLGMVLAGIGVYVVMDDEDRDNARQKAAIAVNATTDPNLFVVATTDSHGNPQSSPYVEVRLSNGTRLHVRRCDPGQTSDCREFLNSACVLCDAEKYGIERDYWTAYNEARHHDLGETMLVTLYVSLLGFPAGLVLWLFYRLVRFAVKG